ncbi:TetR family transcriptional regulator [Comamonas sp. GB3 AK4-5]|uniref:TetR family transcriptional regulator n=1 Tax=Comamonas sp. GB3 AK4-5 TaxID=3231487 RepID=UPI00351F36EA
MSSVNTAGNPEALKAHKEVSQRQTRQELELAFARLRNGNPRRVKRDTAINATAVATEAGIDRSTLYRFHEPILTAIRKFNEATSKQKLEAKQGELGEARTKAREYREALELARNEMAAWARQNYELAHHVQDLKATVKNQHKIISELQARLDKLSRNKAGLLFTAHSNRSE